MNEQYSLNNTVPTTHRSANELAILYGYKDLEELAVELPYGARVLDVGAGISPFAREVATLRPDIELAAIDPRYYDPGITESLRSASPPNVSYIPGDASRLEMIFGSQSFHRIFSYWVLPHLSLREPEPALAMAHAIWNVQRSGGVLKIGPAANATKVGWRDIGRIRHRMEAPAITVVKEVGLSQEKTEEVIRHIVDIVQVPAFLKPAFIAYQEAAAEVLGTNLRRRETQDGTRQIYDPRTGDYVALNGLRGRQIRCRIVWVALRNYPYKL